MEALENVDLLVSATAPYPAPRHTDLTASFQSAEDVRARFFFRRAYTGCYALTALPAISIPGGFTSDNLPIGLQLGARPFAEGTILQAAHAYEQATEWHRRLAPAAREWSEPNAYTRSFEAFIGSGARKASQDRRLTSIGHVANIPGSSHPEAPSPCRTCW